MARFVLYPHGWDLYSYGLDIFLAPLILLFIPYLTNGFGRRLFEYYAVNVGIPHAIIKVVTPGISLLFARIPTHGLFFSAAFEGKSKIAHETYKVDT